ncbi:hypothetical protein [Bradyrhizobium ottawaense]|uniref:hypothetical protein n=1 Tax=Bradyrhizobium ottawaense TaxID=931866 RepID=UPI00041B619A|nr:hypothetical protein [Bradyrhizobium ottawaense]
MVTAFLRLEYACGPHLDVAADVIKHRIGPADALHAVVLEVNELLRAEVECSLTVVGGPVPMTQAN